MTKEQSGSLGARIRSAREERSMSLGDLAKASGVTKGYLSQLERGEAENPSVESVRKIATGLNLHMSELLGEEPSEPAAGGVRLPQGLKALVERARAKGHPIPDGDIEMLLTIRYRGRQPRSADDWGYLYESIRRVVR